jgi:hypothetical protein
LREALLISEKIGEMDAMVGVRGNLQDGSAIQ